MIYICLLCFAIKQNETFCVGKLRYQKQWVKLKSWMFQFDLFGGNGGESVSMQAFYL